MKITGKLVNKISALGILGVIKLIWERYALRGERFLFRRRTRTYNFNETIKICVPTFSRGVAKSVADQLTEIYAQGGGALPAHYRKVELHIPHVERDGQEILIRVGRISVKTLSLPDDLSLLSYTTAFRLVVLTNAQRENSFMVEIESILARLNATIFHSVGELVSYLSEIRELQIHGEARITYPTYEQISLRLSDGHYGYTELLDWQIISELPRKFEIISKTAHIEALPMSSLFEGTGRASRQFGVGKLYGPEYLSGESVLDVGCDICGVKKYVGANTRYFGIDMQGLADRYINLDKESLPFENESFDSVICFEALEHLQDIHGHVDKMLAIAKRYAVLSLYIESAHNGGRSMTRLGEPVGNAHLPIAPVFDRHQWLFTFSDALDFFYYRGRRAGFRVSRLTLFYGDMFALSSKSERVKWRFKTGDIAYLGRHVQVLGIVLERVEKIAH